jgi:hypothetical protein
MMDTQYAATDAGRPNFASPGRSLLLRSIRLVRLSHSVLEVHPFPKVAASESTEGPRPFTTAESS